MTTRHDGGDGGNDRFESLFESNRSRVIRYFRQVFHLSDADAQELTQDTFLRFYRSLKEYDGKAGWALLETIARNVGINRVRSLTTIKRGAVRTESLEDLDSSDNRAVAEHEDPVDRLIKKERLTRLRQAIAELPNGQRRSLQLWLDDFTYEEIAATLRISLDAVRSSIRDAKRRLRERLGDKDALPED